MLSLQNIFMKQRRSLPGYSAEFCRNAASAPGRTCKSSAHNRQEEVPETEKAADKAETGTERARAAAPAAAVIPKEAAKYYNYYCAYLSHLSAQNLDNVFFSNSSEWTAIREQMRQRLGNELYELIMNRFVPQGK